MRRGDVCNKYGIVKVGEGELRRTHKLDGNCLRVEEVCSWGKRDRESQK